MSCRGDSQKRNGPDRRGPLVAIPARVEARDRAGCRPSTSLSTRRSSGRSRRRSSIARWRDQPDQLERFRREARAVAQLSHPNVVSVIDAGNDEDGHPYIVFEYVEGETLKQRIDRLGRLPLDEAAAYAIEVGRGLQSAHEANMVHRDVKPQNVLIDPEGRAKVTDFGIALSLEDDGLTKTGRVLGTTDYVSPEQAMGKAGRRPLGHLLARDPALRDAPRRRPVQGGDARRRRDEARERPDARHPGDRGRARPPRSPP